MINKHDNFLKEYVFSLVENYQTDKAIKLIKNYKDSKNSNFFEAKLLLILDLIKKEKFTLADNILDDFEISEQNDTYELIIYETLKSYNNLFIDQKIKIVARFRLSARKLFDFIYNGGKICFSDDSINLNSIR